ncbi:hypothetical protein [Nonomuraea sp. NPDC049400]|uniref:hypothetical protein n=1 Tax=Nonomuraea sp. NPDC049400 TaxID=3364352 RepID=UPI0037B54A1E
MTLLIERISDRMLSFVAPKASADAGCVYWEPCEDRCAGSRAYAVCHYRNCGSGWEFMYREGCGSC